MSRVTKMGSVVGVGASVGVDGIAVDVAVAGDGVVSGVDGVGAHAASNSNVSNALTDQHINLFWRERKIFMPLVMTKPYQLHAVIAACQRP